MSAGGWSYRWGTEDGSAVELDFEVVIVKDDPRFVVVFPLGVSSTPNRLPMRSSRLPRFTGGVGAMKDVLAYSDGTALTSAGQLREPRSAVDSIDSFNRDESLISLRMLSSLRSWARNSSICWSGSTFCLRFAVVLFLTGDAIDRRFDFNADEGFFVAGAFFSAPTFSQNPHSRPRLSTVPMFGSSSLLRRLFSVAS